MLKVIGKTGEQILLLTVSLLSIILCSAMHRPLSTWHVNDYVEKHMSQHSWSCNPLLITALNGCNPSLSKSVGTGEDGVTNGSRVGGTQNMHKDQLRALIREVLQGIGLYSEAAEELLMLTAAVESNLGDYIRQVGGPARGIFQMEPATEGDIWENYLKYKPNLHEIILDLRLDNQHANRSLEWCLAYQVAMSRVHYLRVKEPLPAANDIEALARYWKKYYNTHLGAGTVEKAIEKYERYVA